MAQAKKNKKTTMPSGKKDRPYNKQDKSAIVKEPAATYHISNLPVMDPALISNATKSRIRAIGNSKGIILNNQLLKDAGIDAGANIITYTENGKIIIAQARQTGINTDISTWDMQFKAAKKKGFKPEGDMFNGLSNDFDSKEW